ncbi:hypothetical protein MCOR23_006634 [Pyricularia oryzae]|nr:hypothetical protein MCOR30_010267 [Pyricularia oryzae]KAI6396475.1 hypothetical protein MCOR23_006634 [Pyricularia oryzae]KAI6436946.1 hypothetical protein MCOR24_000424 [Pyricularia oryzae]
MFEQRIGPLIAYVARTTADRQGCETRSGVDSASMHLNSPGFPCSLQPFKAHGIGECRKPFRKRRQKLKNGSAAMKLADYRDGLVKGFEYYSEKTLEPVVGNGQTPQLRSLSRLANDPWETKTRSPRTPSTRTNGNLHTNTLTVADHHHHKTQAAASAPAMPQKRPGSAESPISTKVKLPKFERDTEDFSSVVKSKLQAYTRTGQACDRCKVRKIRCDALPQGCSHCANQNLECFVTDRVTGRTERRGYIQDLEREKTDMLNHIRALEKVLENNGIEVIPWKWGPRDENYPPGVMFDSMGYPVVPPAEAGKSQWSRVETVWTRNKLETKPTSIPSLYQMPQPTASSKTLESRAYDGCPGVGSDFAPLSSIKGTKLSILGTTVDVTSFLAPDMDDLPTSGAPLYNRSAQAFIQSAYRLNPPLPAELPPRSEAFEYAEWYFIICHPFSPILHKPSFMTLLTRIYDDPAFVATSAELVVVHMVFATIYFQYGVRNPQNLERHRQLDRLASQHYHYCLNKFCDLEADRTITSVHALLLLGLHMRGFSKPGGAYLVSYSAFAKAIELGLNKAAPGVLDGSVLNLETELRSRAWWSVLVLTTALNGHLGRPMFVTMQDFDVPLPTPIPEECLTADGITDRSRIGECTYWVGLAIYQITPAYMDLYANIYSIRRDPRRHAEVVARIEEQVAKWKEELPAELRADDEEQVSQSGKAKLFALIARGVYLELRLMLRHPSACPLVDPDYQAENTRLSEEMSRELLDHVTTVLKLKSGDTTWYQISTYVAAVSCTLAANWERRFSITQEEVARLRREMNRWLGIIEETGKSLGSQVGVCADISKIINHTIAGIEAVRRGGSQSARSSVKTSLSDEQTREQRKPSPEWSRVPKSRSTPVEASSAGDMNGSCFGNTNTVYQPVTTFEDHSNSITSGASVPPTSLGFDPNISLYHTGTGISTTDAGPDATHQQQPNPLVAFASQATQQLASFHSPSDEAVTNANESVTALNTWSGNKNWVDWTSALSDWQDRCSANTLLHLGGSAHQPMSQHQAQQQQFVMNGQHPHPTDIGGCLPVVPVTSAEQWPLLVFNHDGTSLG